MAKPTKRPTRALTAKQLHDCKKILLDEKVGLLNNARLVKLELNTSPDDRPDEADLASSDTGQSMRTRLGNRENLYLKKVLQALARIEEGIYGECDSCGEPIGHARLVARLTAELCISCKEDQEKQENLSVHGTQHKSLGRGLTPRT